MKKTDALVKILTSDIENKDVLEVACGTADFSVSAAQLANSVSCIDLDDSRLTDLTGKNNVSFKIMDASEMTFLKDTFDTIVIYNAFFHIQTQWSEIEKECLRVLKSKGIIYIVGTWKLDTSLMKDVFGDKAFWQDNFLIVKIANA